MSSNALDARAQSLLDAAKRLLEARQDQMVTSDEWRALATAVAALDPSTTADDLLTDADR